jgi:hypothetical protein
MLALQSYGSLLRGNVVAGVGLTQHRGRKGELPLPCQARRTVLSHEEAD